MTGFEETAATIERFSRLRSTDEICTALIDVSSKYGLDKMVAGTAPRPELDANSQKRQALLCGWPDAWLDQYASENYTEIDPVVRYACATPNPFAWSDATAGIATDDPGNRVMSAAREQGLGAGLAMPLITFDGVVVLISLGGEKMELPPKTIGRLSLVATYATARAIQISNQAKSNSECRLTKRETECMKWAAEGKSEWEISCILGISEHTSEKHLLNAKAKLKAINRTHAVAEAIRLGYIT